VRPWRVNLIHVDPVVIRTASGPGGIAGELALQVRSLLVPRIRRW